MIQATAAKAWNWMFGFLAAALLCLLLPAAASAQPACSAPCPQNVVATDGTVVGKVTITWDALADSTDYTVYRDTKSNGNNKAAIGTTGGATSFDDTTATAGDTFHYWVSGLISGVETNLSDRDSGFIGLPAAPTGVTASDDTFFDKVRITWNAVGGATSYTVYRDTATQGNNKVSIGTSAGTSFDDTTATAGTTFYYWVTATESGFESDFGANDSGSRAQPAAPTGVAASDDAFTDKVQITWNAVGGATSYTVYRDTASNGNNKAAIATPAGTSFDDTTATAGDTFYYWVTATISGAESPLSASDSGSRALPGPPSGVTASDGTFFSKVQVDWNAVANADFYTVYRDTNANGSTRKKVSIADVTAITFDDTTATGGTTFFYWVTATVGGTETAFSASDAGFRAQPAAPTGVAASDDTFGDKIQITWNAVSGAASYIVYRDDKSNGNNKVSIGTPVGTSFDDTTAAAATTFFYWVSSVINGSESVLSANDSGSRKQGSLAAPTNVVATDLQFNDRVRITWDAVSGADSYTVYRDSKPAGKNKVSIGTSTTTQFDDMDAEATVVFHYWVTATDGSGESAFSSSDKGSRAVSNTPAVPPGVSATDGQFADKVRVTWSPIVGVDFYTIYRDDQEQGNSKNALGTVASTGNTQFDDKTAAVDKVLYYWVTASNTIGESPFSNPDSGFRVSPTVPSNVQASDGTFPDRVHIVWEALTGAQTYNVYRDTEADGANRMVVGNTKNIFFNDTSAIPEVEYYYWVTRVTGNSESDFSAPDVGVRADGGDIISGPLNVQASDLEFTERIVVTWDAVSVARTYNLYRGTLESGSGRFVVGTPAETSFADETATPAVIYYYWVTAVTASGQESLFSDPDTGRRDMPVPVDVAASGGTSATTVSVTWRAVDGAESYDVYRADDKTGLNAGLIGNATTNAFADNAASPGVVHYYGVRALAAELVSNFSAFRPGFAGLLPPTDLFASNGEYVDKVVITWSPFSFPGISFVIFRSDSANGALSQLGTSETNRFEDTSARPGIVYYYAVVAVSDTAGSSAPSERTSGFVKLPPAGIQGHVFAGSSPLGGATVSVLVAGSSAVVASAVSESDGYYLAEVGDGTFDISVTPPAKSGLTGALVEGIVKNQPQITVDFTLEVADERPPKIVAGPFVEGVSGTAAVIQWKTSEPTTGTVNFGRTTTAESTVADNNLATNHSVRLTGLEPDTEYVVLVTATDKAGNGPVQSKVASFKTTTEDDTKPPAIVAGPVVSAISDTSAVVEWETNEVTTGTVSFGTDSSLGSSVGSGGLAEVHSVALSGLAKSTEYFVQVSVTDASGNGPVESRILSFKTLAGPDDLAPVIVSGPLALDITGTGATISWVTNEPTTGSVSFSDGETHGQAVADTLSNSHSVRLVDLTPDTTYTYSVSATDIHGNGPTRSAPQTFLTRATVDTTPPLIVEGPNATNIGNESAVIRWVTDESSTSTVEFGLSSDALSNSTGGADLTKVHQVPVFGLTPNQTYFYRISSTDANGNGPTVSAVLSFSTSTNQDTTAPVFVSGVQVIQLTDTAATLFWETDELSDTVVDYGLTADLPLRASDRTMVKRHQITISNLERGKPYFLTASSTDLFGNTASTAEVSISTSAAASSTDGAGVTVSRVEEETIFTTSLVPDLTPPIIIEGPTVSTVTDTIAIVTWKTDEIGDSRLDFGPRGGPLSFFIGNILQEFSHQILITNLEPDTEYSFQVASQDFSANLSAISAVVDFTTLTEADLSAPVIQDGTIEVIVNATNVQISWLTDEPATSEVKFGLAELPLTNRRTTDGLSTSHAVRLTNLERQTEYEFTLVSRDISGNQTESALDSFTTLVDNALPPVENDDFAAATVAVGTQFTVFSNTVNASRERREPEHAGEPGIASAWWRWRAPIGAPTLITTTGSDFDTVLAVYTGDALHNLELVVGDNNPDSMTSQVTFEPVFNRTYFIVVDGAAGAAGSVTLSLSMSINADVVASFGSITGVWTYTLKGGWVRIAEDSAETLLSADLDGNGVSEIVASFGDPWGTWIRWNGLSWTEFNDLSANKFAAADIDGDGKKDLIADFGEGRGVSLKTFDQPWTVLNTNTAISITIGDLDGNGQAEILLDLGEGLGLWSWENNTEWFQIYEQSPAFIAIADLDASGQDDVIMDLGAEGIWVLRNNGDKEQITGATTGEGLAVGDLNGNGQDDLVVDFGAESGLWVFMDNATWSKINVLSPDSITVADLDGDGLDDLLVDFGPGFGTWIFRSPNLWEQIIESSVEAISAAAN